MDSPVMVKSDKKTVRTSYVRWSVLAIISLMYMVTYIDRSNISVAAPAIAKELSLSKIELGLIFSAFIWAYAIGQVPGGWLADRFGPRRVLLIIVPFWSLMTSATAFASGLTSLFAIRFIFGLGEAGAFPTASRAMQLWFPRSERGLVQAREHRRHFGQLQGRNLYRLSRWVGKEADIVEARHPQQ